MKSFEIKEICLYQNNTINHVIAALNKGGKKIVLIIDKKNRLIGTISDGDLRRAFIRGKTLNSKISSVFNRKPYFIKKLVSTKKLKSLMFEKKVNNIPLVDNKRKIIDLINLEDLEKNYKKNNLVIIMSGGKGQRLQPLTNNTPKPLLKVNKKPIIEHIINQAKEDGFINFVLSINYLGHKIKKYFKNGSKLGVNITYIEEKKPLGTAGSITILKKKIDKPVIVINGDVFTKLNFSNFMSFHINTHSKATVGVKLHEYKNPYGVVNINKDGDIKKIIEKPSNISFVNAGIYILDKSVIKKLKIKHLDMTDLLQDLINKKIKINAFPIHEEWSDIGNKQDLLSLRKLTNRT
tara:strand:- start:5881 stop:6930 length:1050 start_codon:yes stop_codon:yes gene_type:complete